MPCKISNCFNDNLTFEKMIEAHNRAKIGKTSRGEILRFELNLENNIVNLIEDISNGRYKLGKYRVFKIYEPKERVIMSLPYIDRVVHQWYVEEFVKKNIVPKFIKDTYACIEDRGTHKAVDTLQRYMRIKSRQNKEYYVLKCDIKKFFYSIDQSILYNIMTKYIRDKALLEFSKILIYSDGDGVGIPIGNYTSQFFANIYLHELDTFIKHKLKAKCYVRYMDDFVLLLDTKEECTKIMTQIKQFININLKIELNEKSGYYPSKRGVDFCGYRIWNTHKLLRNSSKKKIKKCIKKWNILYKNDELDVHRAILSLNSWLGHASHANSYRLSRKVLCKCEFLYSFEKEVR